MRGRAGYLVAALALAAGLGVATLILIQHPEIVAAHLQQVVVPGEHQIALARAGPYTLFHERRAVIEGRYFATDRQLNGLRLRLRSVANEQIAIGPPSVLTRYSFADREGSAIATFSVPRAGTYHLSAWYPEDSRDPTAVLAIGQGVERRSMTAMLGALGAGAVGLLACSAIAAGTYRRRRRDGRRVNGSATEEVIVKTKILGIAVGFLIGSHAFAQPPKPAGPAGQPRPPLASVDSRWENVYCDLTELSRTSPSELTVRYRYRNVSKRPHALQHIDLVPRTRALDPVGRTLFGVLKDTSGEPISSTNMDGLTARPIPAGASQAHWARLQAPPDGVTSLTILIDGCLPFDDVPIGGTTSAPPRSAPAPALASQEGEAEGLMVELTGVNRTAGGFVTIEFRYRNTGAAPHRFPHAPMIRGAYFLDSANRRKYEVAHDRNQAPLCSETLNFNFPSGVSLEPGEVIALWAKFAAPPESTKTVSVHLPLAPPFDNVSISGAGAGSAAAGMAVEGSVVGLDAALKDLGAKVTDTEIRIDLSADVLFDFDKAEIKKEAEPSLQKVVTVLNANPGAKVAIEGHTDGKGADAYNQTLSEQRAASVKQWLVANAKVNGANVTTRGWGKSKPVAHNAKPDGSDDPDGRAKNRRVEIVVRKGA